MTAKKFSNALGNIGENYVDEAITYTAKKKTNPWVKWGAMAACLCLVFGFSALFIFDSGQSSDPLPGGVTAEVLEIIDSNTWKVVVTGGDNFYSNGEVVFVTLEGPSDTTENFSLCVGDEIAITYTNYDIVKNKDGSSEILVPQIEIIN